MEETECIAQSGKTKDPMTQRVEATGLTVQITATSRSIAQEMDSLDPKSRDVVQVLWQELYNVKVIGWQ
jgi:hypothetical protein